MTALRASNQHPGFPAHSVGAAKSPARRGLRSFGYWGSGPLCGGRGKAYPAGMVPEIDCDAARGMLDEGGATFVDIRDPGSFQAGHIPGARHLGDHNVRDFVASEDPSRTVVVYCYHGNTSLGGAVWLREQGFEDVYSLTGGFEAWRQAFDDRVEQG